MLDLETRNEFDIRNPSFEVIPGVLKVLAIIYPVNIGLGKVYPFFWLKALTLPSFLKRFRQHLVGQSPWAIKKSLVTLPIGIYIPPSIKAIIGITIAPFGLRACQSPRRQCCVATPGGILYWVSKASMPLGVSTRLANLPLKKVEGKTAKE